MSMSEPAPSLPDNILAGSRRAEAELRESEARYRLLVHATAQSVWRTTGDGEFILEVVGSVIHPYEAGRTSTMEWLAQNVHRDDQAPTLAAWRQAIATSDRYDMVHRIRSLGGGYRHVHSCALPLMDAQGNVREWIGTSTDETNRVLAADAVRRSEERYRTLFISIDEGFCVIEVLFDGDVRAIDFRYLEINPAFTQHTGLRDVVGKRAREVTPDLEEEWFETYGRVATTGEAVRFVSQSRNLGGRWFDAYAFHLDGMASHQVAVLFRDITASKMLERLRVDILALAGHDLRTPLTVVNLAAQLLRAKQTYDAGSVDRILSEARRMGRMVDDLSDAFRLESGLAALRSAPLDLVPLVNESVVRIRSQASSHTIMIESPAEPVFGDWDRERLGQALSHLLEYAIKNSPNGGTILVRVSVGDAEVSISVVNYGAGISVEAASQSDDRLERTGEDERASRLDIGLFIAQMHIEAHGGRFRIKSEPGNGRSFNFSLPRGV